MRGGALVGAARARRPELGGINIPDSAHCQRAPPRPALPSSSTQSSGTESPPAQRHFLASLGSSLRVPRRRAPQPLAPLRTPFWCHDSTPGRAVLHIFIPLCCVQTNSNKLSLWYPFFHRPLRAQAPFRPWVTPSTSNSVLPSLVFFFIHKLHFRGRDSVVRFSSVLSWHVTFAVIWPTRPAKVFIFIVRWL